MTIEAEVDLPIAGAADGSFLIVDCLTVWVGNLMHHGHDDVAIQSASTVAIQAVRTRSGDTAVVILAVRKIGGVAGDVLGAVEQIVECLVMVVATGLAARHSIWWR